MNKKIRDHEVQYASYILIVGEKEKESKSANVRIRDTKEQKDILLSELIQKVSLEKEKRLITSIFSS
jgi:threonyl-tRNA synthetase